MIKVGSPLLLYGCVVHLEVDPPLHNSYRERDYLALSTGLPKKAKHCPLPQQLSESAVTIITAPVAAAAITADSYVACWWRRCPSTHFLFSRSAYSSKSLTDLGIMAASLAADAAPSAPNTPALQANKVGGAIG